MPDARHTAAAMLLAPKVLLPGGDGGHGLVGRLDCEAIRAHSE
jgi:hypothetical protein